MGALACQRAAALLEVWDERIAASRDQFVDELISRGFRLHDAPGDRRLIGEIAIPPNQDKVAVRLALPEGWPYRPTKVWPVARDQRLSWHQESDGALCLFSGSSAGLPWADVDLLLKKTKDWFVRATTGWPDDEPDLDLERYFESDASSALLVYDDVDRLIGRLLRIAKRGGGTVLEPRVSGKGTPQGKRFGWALDLGELPSPVRTWEEVLARAGDSARHADTLVKQVESAVILLKYQRGTHTGVVALRASRDDGEVRLKSIESASDSEHTRRLRAGYDARSLARFDVTVVGMGAIGSVLADQLSRSGVGKLRLIDNERLRPGNSIRHLVGQEAVGERKARAVADRILAAAYVPQRGVEPAVESIRSPAQAAQAFEAADLVVDATGNPTTTSLLASAADGLRQRLLAVYLQRDGDIGRVERYPRLSNESPQPPASRGPREHRALRESGCGDPVSPAPPSAALALAGLASLAAADLLLERPVPPSTTYVLRPQTDDPYQVRSILQ